MGNLIARCISRGIPDWVQTDEDRAAYARVRIRCGQFTRELETRAMTYALSREIEDERRPVEHQAKKMRLGGSSDTPTMTRGAEYERAVAFALDQDSSAVNNLTPSNGAAFFNAQQSAAAATALAANNNQEKYLVPHFYRAMGAVLQHLHPSLAIVDSESYPWLPQLDSVTKLTPDLFVCPYHIVNFRQPYANSVDASMDYGTIDGKTLESVVVYIGAKAAVTDETAMDVVDYCRISSLQIEGTARGIVFDAVNARMITAESGSLTRVRTFGLTDAGSRLAIVQFLSGHFCAWDAVLSSVLHQAGLAQPQRHTTATMAANEHIASCFLGAGTFGRVIRVRSADPTNPADFALKYSLSLANRVLLKNEYDQIASLPAHLVGTAILGVQQGTYGQGNFVVNRRTIAASWYLMPLGIPFRSHSEVTAAHGRSILRVLSDIHASGYVHGDSRYRNVVRLQNGQCVWVDLSLVQPAVPGRMANDVRKFLESCRRPINEDAIETYSTTNYPDASARHLAVSALF